MHALTCFATSLSNICPYVCANLMCMCAYVYCVDICTMCVSNVFDVQLIPMCFSPQSRVSRIWYDNAGEGTGNIKFALSRCAFLIRP